MEVVLFISKISEYPELTWTASSEFGTYRLCEQRMRSWNLSWRNARRHKFAWRGSLGLCHPTSYSWQLVCSGYVSPVKRICVFEHSVMTNFNCACPANQRARDLVFCLKVPLDSLLVGASSEGSGETARMRRLAWTFAARIGDKYQIRLTRSMWRVIRCLPWVDVSTFISFLNVLAVWVYKTHCLIKLLLCNSSRARIIRSSCSILGKFTQSMGRKYVI